MAHKYSTETLFHLTCSTCKSWWSYASPDKHIPADMFCPHCGRMDATASSDPLPMQQTIVKLTPHRVACGD